jgi:AcrR family transcriptional regulator
MMPPMKSRPPSERPPRIRRTAEDARSEILDATERRLVASGPSGIRLQDVADDVGVSHPTILHHFGSRERLVNDVVKRRIDAMNLEVFNALATGVPEEASVRALFERISTVFGAGGHARVVAFLALDNQDAPTLDGVQPLAAAVHATRLAELPEGAKPPTLEDSYFTVLLISFALFGDAIAGSMFRGESADSKHEESSERFRAWLARLVQLHLERP